MNVRERGRLLPPAALCLAAGLLLGREANTFLWGLAALILILPACILLRGRLRFCALLALALAVGCLRGYGAWHPSLPPEQKAVFSGVITAEVEPLSGGRVRSFLSHVAVNGEPLSAAAYWSFYAEEIPDGLVPGKQVAFRGSLYHPGGASNPGGYDFREELLRRGATVGLYGMEDLAVEDPAFFSIPGWTAALRHRLTLRLTDGLGEEAGGYAAAMLLGVRSGIGREDRSAFSRLGIAHILSVSGFHVGLLVSALALLFRLLRLPQKLRLALYAVTLGLYCALCGFAQPVIRASLLLLLGLYGRILARPRSGLHLLCAAFAAMLLASPVQLTGLSFQLSFGAVLGITLITPFLRSLWDSTRRAGRWLRDGLAAGLGAQLGILIPELAAFHELPLLGLIVNLPVLSLASVWILLDWAVLLTLPVPGLSPLVCAAARGLTSLLLGGIRRLGAIPGITLWTGAPGIGTILGLLALTIALCGLLRLRRRVRISLAAVGALAGFCSLFPLPHRSTEYLQFSVGNADAAVLRDRETVWVIDTGYDDGVLSDYLHRCRLTPDAVILTHLHADHANGLAAMMEDGIPIPLCYIPEGGEQAAIHPDVLALLDRLRASGTEIRALAAGDTLPLPSGQAKVLWPERGKVRPGQDANESCLVLRLELMGVSLLQTGDLDGRYEMYAAAPADLLKVAHHGSESSTSPDFLASVAPRAALLSCEREERDQRVRERFGAIPVYSTALGGQLTVRFSPSAFTVEPFLPHPDPAAVPSPAEETSDPTEEP